MYADDASISSSSQNPLQLFEDLKRELEGMMDWLRQNKLKFNVAKCEYMFIGNDKQLSKSLKLVTSKLIKMKSKW